MDRSTANAHTDRRPLSAEDVADMLDTLESANVHTTIAGLEDLLATLRPAAVIPSRLADVDFGTFKAALILRAQRAGSQS
jgi:hypothetical protein